MTVFLCSQSSAFSDDDELFILNRTRPVTPLVLNPGHRASCWDVFAYEQPEEEEEDEEQEKQLNPHLPTPEERMRQQAGAVPADIVPINITGNGSPNPGAGRWSELTSEF